MLERFDQPEKQARVRHTIARREFLAGLVLAPTLRGARAGESAETAGEERLAAIEASQGGRLGVFVIDTGSDRVLAHRADERFPMCSSFKALAVAALLAKVDSGQERLDRKISLAASDLLDYAPVTKAHLVDGGMSLGDLSQPLKAWSDVGEVDRIGIEQEFVKVLGVEIPHIIIPVRPGRDLARLVEVAAFQTKLKLSGHNAAQELNDRLIAHMSPASPPPAQ